VVHAVFELPHNGFTFSLSAFIPEGTEVLKDKARWALRIGNPQGPSLWLSIRNQEDLPPQQLAGFPTPQDATEAEKKHGSNINLRQLSKVELLDIPKGHPCHLIR